MYTLVVVVVVVVIVVAFISFYSVILDIFASLDTDHSSALDWSEFSQQMADKSIFDNLNTNKNDGGVTRQELKAAITVLNKAYAVVGSGKSMDDQQ